MPVLIRLPDLSAGQPPVAAATSREASSAAPVADPSAPAAPGAESPAAGAATRSRRRYDGPHTRRRKNVPAKAQKKPAGGAAGAPLIDKSKLLVAVALIAITGATYFAIQGGKDSVPAGTAEDQWSSTGPSQADVAQQPPAELAEPTVDLWPAAGTEIELPDGSSSTAATPQTMPPAAGGASSALAGDAHPDHHSVAGGAAGAHNEGTRPVSGWPSDTSQLAPAAGTSDSVQGWPDDLPGTTAAPPAARYYDSTAVYPDQPAARTGMRDETAESGASNASNTSGGSRLDGNITIPRPPSNYQRHGSELY